MIYILITSTVVGVAICTVYGAVCIKSTNIQIAKSKKNPNRRKKVFKKYLTPS